MPYITNSNDKQISVRDIAEQHVEDDLGHAGTVDVRVGNKELTFATVHGDRSSLDRLSVFSTIHAKENSSAFVAVVSLKHGDGGVERGRLQQRGQHLRGRAAHVRPGADRVAAALDRWREAERINKDLRAYAAATLSRLS